jgi:plastocyanin
MSVTNKIRSALVAAALGSATATTLVVAVLPGTAQAAPPVTQANAHTVSSDNFTFMPQTLTVKAGTTVTWTNRDDIQRQRTMPLPNQRHWTPMTATR